MDESKNPRAGRKCTRCGADLGGMLQPDLCPKCLLEAGLETQPAAGPTGTIALPSLETPFPGLPQSGDQLGHYQIVRLLGQGGMGAAFEAEDLENGRRVALKLLGHKLDSPQARERFFREGKLAASINHPNSVYVFGTEEIAGTPVIAMELVPGGTLHQRVEAKGPLAPGLAVDCALQVIAGLEAAERIGILHRDVKPSNCFIDTDGTVKIGDFGLSISTEVRTEPALTATGTFLGTPAFCSPEQLRGEELNARSDIYSVGATLFYLLTGRTPFEGKNVVQLLATVLERPVPSPKQLRASIPTGLAKIVMRCLQKQPGERFKSYQELTRALTPFSSAAPTPATLGLRLLAGILDQQILALIGVVVQVAMFGSLTATMDVWFKGRPGGYAMFAALAVVGLFYYSVPESIWGATLGKAICRLRVVTPDKGPPGFGRSLGRALMYTMIPAAPTWLAWMISGGRPAAFLNASNYNSTLLAISIYAMLALLFCTARRRNSFAAVHDLLTDTRVISRTALQVRPPLDLTETAPAQVESKPRVGPYYVLEQLGRAGRVQWVLGYDLHLLRKVWIRMVPPGTDPVPVNWRNISRPGRLRWLTQRRSPEENWDAFEGVAGHSLLKLIQSPQPWSHVRYWLHDLATELSAAEKDGTLPARLSLEQIWITGDGRAKLLGFPAPGLSDAMDFDSNAPPSIASGDRVQSFLGEVAAVALGSTAAAKTPSEAVVPLPLHARDFLKKLPELPGAEAVATALQPLLSRFTVISRLRRASVVFACVAFPMFSVLMLGFGISLLEKWDQDYPGLFQLNTLLKERSTSRYFKNLKNKPSDEQYSVFIAAHYRSLITNESAWSSPIALAMVKGDDRRFAERSVVERPAPSETEISDADVMLKSHLKNERPFHASMARTPGMAMTVFLATFVLYVMIPALIAALLFRGGAIQRFANIAFVRKDGARASRLRVFWRALVAWSPVVASLFFLIGFPGRFLMASVPMAVAWIGLMGLLSLALPGRGLQDRLAGTWPVPR